MAPIKKLTKKEVRLQKRPWITNGILISMKNRDKTYKEFIKEKDPALRNTLHTRYKRMRNLIISLIRNSKKDYYSFYFEQHKSNVKKTWEGIRDIVKVAKKAIRRLLSCVIITSYIHQILAWPMQLMISL